MAGSVDARHKVVLVTGCSADGIGAALCDVFLEAQCGYHVVATARNPEKIKLRAAAAGTENNKDAEWTALRMDVTDAASVEQCVAEVMEKYGRIDIVVNNAGMTMIGTVAETPLEDMQNVFDTNVYGAIRVIQAVAPHMKKQRSGLIVNVSSIVSELATPFSGTYCATKSALNAFSDALRMEMKPFGIKVLVVLPGAIRSNFSNNIVAHAKIARSTWYTMTTLERRAQASQRSNPTPAHDFAQLMLPQIEKCHATGSPSYVRAGSLSTMFLVWKHLPRALTDALFDKHNGVSESAILPN
ncbi:Retinol dehydrogenase 8 [Porphyridium purpureum]|uniref:Retinol dehydrogenase 8 n=1 Tax=Porphyridium purpureum TaxID=35688 RepID=A0A5J4YK27_PORPP|nr:Retinol dehydrogenase 8 [Porphyridium purpureum]|eukprot:POR4806..scf291_13